MNRRRWRAWVVAAVIFLLGVAVGGASVTMLGIRKFRQALRSPETAPSFVDRAVERIGADLTESLELTPEETARVEATLARSAASLKALRVRRAAEAARVVRMTVEELAAELPPEKRAKFHQLVARRYEKLGLPAPTLEP